MRRFVWCAAFAIALVQSVGIRAGLAASCCGGSSAADALSLPKFLQAAANVRLAVTDDLDLRSGDGDRLQVNSWRTTESRLSIAGAYRLGEDWQGSVAAPIIVKRAAASGREAWGGGLGDMSLALRYEWLDEDTCYAHPATGWSRRDVMPAVHFFSRLRLPSGRAETTASDPLGARLTGSGDWLVAGGAEVIKVWGKWGHSLDLSAGRSWPRWHLTNHQPAWQVTASGYLMWYPRYLAFVGAGVSQEANFRETAPRQTATDARAFLSWMFHDRPLWLRADLAARGAAGKNTPLSWSAGLSLAHVWY